ncbi:unnamed protein product, partial [marine sediment metagenome]
MVLGSRFRYRDGVNEVVCEAQTAAGQLDNLTYAQAGIQHEQKHSGV